MGLDAASSDRWLHLKWEVDPELWRRGMIENWKSKVPASQLRIEARHIVTAYMSKNSKGLGGAAPKEGWGESWGRPDSTSPRSWDALSAVLASLVKLGYAKTIPKAATCGAGILVVRGLVGATNQREFFQWLDFDDLPDPEDVLSGKVKLPAIKDRAGVALVMAITAALRPHKDQKRRAAKALNLLVNTPKDIALPASKNLLLGLDALPAEVVNFIDRDPAAQRDMTKLYTDAELTGKFD